MAYANKYRFEYKDKYNTKYGVILQKEGYLGEVQDGNLRTKINLNYQSSEDKVCIGSMLNFSFITRDKTMYEDLLFANLRSYKVLFQINDTTKWTGFLVTDSIITSYFDYNYIFDIEANDGIGELDNAPLTDLQGNNITLDNISLLELVRNGLNKTDLDLAEIAVCINTKESLSGTHIFKNIKVKGSRFRNNKNGKTEYLDSKKTIEECLKLFNAKVFQYDNKFYIVNELEEQSTIKFCYFDTLNPTGDLLTNNNTDEVNNHIKDISNYEYTSNSQTLIRPVSNVSLIFAQRNEPINLVINGSFNSTSLSFWSVDSINTVNLNVVDGEFNINADGKNNIINSGTMTVEKNLDTDRIIVSVDYYLKNVNFLEPLNEEGIEGGDGTVIEIDPAKPRLYLTVIRPDGSTQKFPAIALEYGQSTVQFEAENIGSGQYSIRFEDTPYDSDSDYDSITYRLDNIYFTNISDVDPTTFDKLFEINNDLIPQTETKEYRCIIGDGLQFSDTSSLIISSDLTSTWNSYNKEEYISINYLFLLNKLRLNSKFRNKLSLKFITTDDVNFIDHLILDNKKYIIRDYKCTFDAVYKYYDILIEELVTDDL